VRGRRPPAHQVEHGGASPGDPGERARQNGCPVDELQRRVPHRGLAHEPARGDRRPPDGGDDGGKVAADLRPQGGVLAVERPESRQAHVRLKGRRAPQRLENRLAEEVVQRTVPGERHERGHERHGEAHAEEERREQYLAGRRTAGRREKRNHEEGQDRGRRDRQAVGLLAERGAAEQQAGHEPEQGRAPSLGAVAFATVAAPGNGLSIQMSR
jgi:hypothetical protein